MNLTIIRLIGAVFLLVLLVQGCSGTQYPPLPVVKNVDVKKYAGKWFEIARMPFSRQENCTCTTAEYTIIDSATIGVLNSCIDTTSGELETAKGKAFVTENSGNAKLKVQFFWPFKGDYWIIDLDTVNYTYAVIGMPSRKYAWILSRSPEMDTLLYKKSVNTLQTVGYDVSRLIKTKQK